MSNASKTYECECTQKFNMNLLLTSSTRCKWCVSQKNENTIYPQRNTLKVWPLLNIDKVLFLKMNSQVNFKC